jgi:hypothetical protein
MESLVSQIVIQFAFTSTHPSLTVNDTNQPNWQVSSWQRRLLFLLQLIILFDNSLLTVVMIDIEIHHRGKSLFDRFVLHGHVCFFLYAFDFLTNLMHVILF